MSDKVFLEFVKDELEELGEITSRAMFGGYSIYKDALIFAIIDDNDLYLKGVGNAAKVFEGTGSVQFSYQGKKGIVKMCYWKVPSDIIDDKEKLINWANLAIKSAKESKRKN
jgi:DNA transformation protein